MSSLFTHVFIPVAILLIFSKELKFDPRNILILSFFALLPDADAIFLPHRAMLHNILMIVIPFLLFILVKSKREIFSIIFFFLASHLLLDLFDGGIFLFYPFYDSVFFARVELLFTMETIKPVLDYGISDQIMNNGRGEPMISSENIVVAFLLMVFSVLVIILRKMKRTSQT
ncbi:MAG: metal-dependent hydrolase [Candidatus Methanoperedens sp.]|nr:metal-dependent hydrolase [Candidatus Methanoperedens sp.]MCE8428510.1 metal-dependent hydrolase [Candidatus Methanoperedens sp.]